MSSRQAISPKPQANKAKAVIFGEKKVASEETTTTPVPSLPFVDQKTVKKQPILGTMLPVTLMGAVYTHGLDNLVRLRLSRDVSGEHSGGSLCGR